MPECTGNNHCGRTGYLSFSELVRCFSTVPPNADSLPDAVKVVDGEPVTFGLQVRVGEEEQNREEEEENGEEEDSI
jgi:hypothetical protein